MFPSSTLCRAQEEFHRARATAATLENVRAVAESAAAAWGHEALAAERREARSLKTRATAELLAAQKQQAAEEAAERAPSETPDRDFETA